MRNWKEKSLDRKQAQAYSAAGLMILPMGEDRTWMVDARIYIKRGAIRENVLHI